MKFVMILAAVAATSFAAPALADGKALYLEKTCIACHGKDAKKPEVKEGVHEARGALKWISEVLKEDKK